MPDLADLADERIELDLAFALAERRPSGPPAVGWCWNCGEPLHNGARWCDAECRDDWEADQRRNAQEAMEATDGLPE